MVDQSLLRQAADRGVTICFADLDGADGLWVPEERTVLVNRGLSEAQAAEVIEHELAHVMIDDQHADLDAGKDVLAGRPPWRIRRPETVALTAALSLVAVVGGVMYGISAARGDDKLDRVAPNPNGTGLTASESADPRHVPPNVVVRYGPNGETIYITLTPTPGTPTPTASATGSPTASATVTKQAPATAPRSTVPVPAPPTSSPTPPVVPTTDPPLTTPPPLDPSTPAVTTPAGASAGGGVGDTGADTAPTPSEQATVADASIAPPPTDVVSVDSTITP